MIHNQSTHAKGNLYRLTVALLMVLSVFSVSGFIGLSPDRPQKVTTELLLTAGQKSIAHIGYYWQVQRTHNVAAEDQRYQQGYYRHAIIRFNDLVTIRYNYLLHEFLKIKPVMQQHHDQGDVLNLLYEPLSA